MTKIVLNLKFTHVKSLKLQTQLLLIVSFFPLYIHAFERKDNILPSKLEILFLLDTGASISVLNLPTFHVIAKQLNLNVPKDIENKRAKTLTVANQTEVPIVPMFR